MDIRYSPIDINKNTRVTLNKTKIVVTGTRYLKKYIKKN